MGFDWCILSNEAVTAMPANMFTTLPDFCYDIFILQFDDWIRCSRNRIGVNREVANNIYSSLPIYNCIASEVSLSLIHI